jgi:hypothetical protein
MKLRDTYSAYFMEDFETSFFIFSKRMMDGWG